MRAKSDRREIIDGIERLGYRRVVTHVCHSLKPCALHLDVDEDIISQESRENESKLSLIVGIFEPAKAHSAIHYIHLGR